MNHVLICTPRFTHGQRVVVRPVRTEAVPAEPVVESIVVEFMADGETIIKYRVLDAWGKFWGLYLESDVEERMRDEG